MLFASNVVDGLVLHQLGGWKLEWACKWIGNKCPEGTAVTTGPGNKELAQHYDHIIHTVAPFYHHYDDGDVGDCLRSCYQESLQLALSSLGQGEDTSSSSSSSSSSTLRIASLLLGAAGVEDFP
jgi:O-acetyl-ADP-ribose deacetylase (regulator of RNase III)